MEQIIQKAFIEVNEEGTEAAAATGIMTKSIALPQKVLVLNKPFIFYIKETNSGIPLFSGLLANPQQ